MRKEESVLGYIARNKVVEKLIKTSNHKDDRNIEDFVQEIYLILCEKGEELEKFNEQPPNNLRNYLITIIRNQYYSGTSAYFRKYVKYDKNTSCFDTSEGFDIDEDNNLIKMINDKD